MPNHPWPGFEQGGFEEVTIFPDIIQAARERALRMKPQHFPYKLGSDHTPVEITTIAERLAQLRPALPMFERASVERYRVNTLKFSEATVPRLPTQLPPRLIGAVAVVSLDSMAEFTGMIDGIADFCKTRCYPGTAILMHPALVHMVSPPKQGGVRHVIRFTNPA